MGINSQLVIHALVGENNNQASGIQFFIGEGIKGFKKTFQKKTSWQMGNLNTAPSNQINSKGGRQEIKNLRT